MEFFDTNVLVYAVDPGETVRCATARALVRNAIDRRALVISTQVMMEFRATVLRRKLMTAELAAASLRDFAAHHVVPATADSLWRVFDIQDRYGFSIWDAAIVQAALEARCEVLFTEDLQHGQRIDSLQVVNPFIGAVHEPAPAYLPSRGRRAKA